MSTRDVPEPALRTLAWRYFIGGFMCLPWLWLVNFIYIFPETRRRPELHKTIRNLTLASLAGSVFFLVLVITWLSIFLTQRTNWGATGDRLSQNIPLGS
ncbi:gamma-secretase aspartyl protease complex, presenilin enhancer-2 subunit [Powellomyces hirtus]|nr:gamma-secretase aspartyl protease complex, presenilin enhancer-2 subunit [Powellomyces hirtus]